MIQTIRLDHVLRESVATPYRNLVTRPTGAAVRGRIERAIAESDCATALLDFSEVELLDLSCADEIVAKLLLLSVPRAEHYVVLWGLSENQVEAIDHVLHHQRLSVAALLSGAAVLVLLGEADPDARDAFGMISSLGPAGAPALAAALGWTEPRARTTLAWLADRRLVRAAGDAFHPLLAS